MSRGGRRRRPGCVKVCTDYADGREAYTGMYEITPGRYVLAGTFLTHAQAESAWMDMAGQVRRGLRLDPRKGRTGLKGFAVICLETVAHA